VLPNLPFPHTCKVVAGFVVPIPTFPVEVIRTLSELTSGSELPVWKTIEAFAAARRTPPEPEDTNVI
jgi:hypothetical protein